MSYYETWNETEERWCVGHWLHFVSLASLYLRCQFWVTSRLLYELWKAQPIQIYNSEIVSFFRHIIIPLPPHSPGGIKIYVRIMNVISTVCCSICIYGCVCVTACVKQYLLFTEVDLRLCRPQINNRIRIRKTYIVWKYFNNSTAIFSVLFQ